jgi:hypothetical protein
VLIGFDVGFSAKSVILIFADYGQRFHLIARIMTVGRWDGDKHSKLIDYIFLKYNAVKPTYVGIDCTSGEGRAIADKLTNMKETADADLYKEQLYRVVFSSSEVVRREVDARGREREIKEGLKDLTARILQGLFVKWIMRQRALVLPYDTDILEDFNREYRHRDEKTGKTALGTPDDVHIPEAMRCVSYLIWLFYVKEVPLTEGQSAFAMPMAQSTPNSLSVGVRHVN